MIDKIKKYSIALCVAIGLIGCGGDAKFETQNNARSLTIGETVIVYTGDKVIPENEETVIDVEHTLNDNTKSVTLISGSASLLRGDYAISQGIK